MSATLCLSYYRVMAASNDCSRAFLDLDAMHAPTSTHRNCIPTAKLYDLAVDRLGNVVCNHLCSSIKIHQDIPTLE